MVSGARVPAGPSVGTDPEADRLRRVRARLLARYLGGFTHRAQGLSAALERLAARGDGASGALRAGMAQGGGGGYVGLARGWREAGGDACGRGDEELAALARLVRGIAAARGGNLAPEALRARASAVCMHPGAPPAARRILALADQAGGTNEWSVPASPERTPAFRAEMGSLLRELRAAWATAPREGA